MTHVFRRTTAAGIRSHKGNCGAITVQRNDCSSFLKHFLTLCEMELKIKGMISSITTGELYG